jgi:hypothetical protein
MEDQYRPRAARTGPRLLVAPAFADRLGVETFLRSTQIAGEANRRGRRGRARFRSFDWIEILSGT